MMTVSYLLVSMALTSLLSASTIISLCKELGGLGASLVPKPGVVLGSFMVLKVGMPKFPSSANHAVALVSLQTDCHAGVSGTIFEYGALTLNGEEYIPFKQYAGKYVLFVNVASF